MYTDLSNQREFFDLDDGCDNERNEDDKQNKKSEKYGWGGNGEKEPYYYRETEACNSERGEKRGLMTKYDLCSSESSRRRKKKKKRENTNNNGPGSVFF